MMLAPNLWHMPLSEVSERPKALAFPTAQPLLRERCVRRGGQPLGGRGKLKGELAMEEGELPNNFIFDYFVLRNTK